MKWRRDVVLLLSVIVPLVLGSAPARTNGASAEAQRGTGRFITGIVTDQGKTPLLGVIVTVHCHITSLGPDKYRWVFSDQLNVPGATTEADGRFRIEGPDDGWYCLLVSPPRHAARIVYDVPAGTKDMTIEVRKGGMIAGRAVQIRDGKKVPIPNVAVKATSSAWDPYLDLGARKELETTTDSDGRFQLENLCTDERAVLSVTPGREMRQPRTWRISAGERCETITFDQDGESRVIEFALTREVHILIDTLVLEIKHGIKASRQAAAQIHGFLVEAASKDASDDAIKRIPSAADLTGKPRTVLARYLQSGQLYPSVVEPFVELLETLGWVKMWGSSQVLTEAGKEHELNAFREVWFLGGGRCDYGQEWRALGYPEVPRLDVVAWPADGDKAVRFELNAETWCGIRRTPDQPPRTDGLRKIAFSTERTVTNGESALILLWDCGQDAEIHEEEDLFFLMVQPYVVPSLKPNAEQATGPRQIILKESGAKNEAMLLKVKKESLETLLAGSTTSDVSPAGDAGVLREIGQKLASSGLVLLDDAQLELFTAAARKHGLVTSSLKKGFIAGSGRWVFQAPTSYVAGYDEPDDSSERLIRKEEFALIGFTAQVRARESGGDEIELLGSLRATNLDGFKYRQYREGFSYQIPVMHTVAQAVDGLSLRRDQTALFAAEVDFGPGPSLGRMAMLFLIRAQRGRTFPLYWRRLGEGSTPDT